MFDVIVAGAGFAGMTAARLLAENGKKVLIIERRKTLAGNCYDETNDFGITVHKYGPHIFHTKSKKCWDFVNRFSKFNGFQHRVLSYANGAYYKFPINRDTLSQVFGTQLSNDEVQPYLQNQVCKSHYNKEIKNFRDAVVSQVGETLYDMFFHNYTSKQWGRDPEELMPELASRIPVRNNADDRYFTDRYQGLPVRGYTYLAKNMIDHENISIMYGVDYFEIKDLFPDVLTIFTGELDRFFDYSEGHLDYRSVKIEFETYHQKEFQPACVVNYPNDYDFTRITEFKKMTLEESSDTTICREYPSVNGEKLYVVPDEKNQKCRESYMNKVKELEKSGKYLFIGRLAEYRYYNMDAVILSALDKTQSWIDNHQ